MDGERITIDPLFVGCTRPAMMLGTTYSACILNAMLSCIVFLAAGNILWLLVGVPVHGLLMAVCRYEPRQFELLRAWLGTKGKARTRAFWQASSYAPLPGIRRGRQAA
jgi:type IV secretion system protein VirB3